MVDSSVFDDTFKELLIVEPVLSTVLAHAFKVPFTTYFEATDVGMVTLAPLTVSV